MKMTVCSGLRPRFEVGCYRRQQADGPCRGCLDWRHSSDTSDAGHTAIAGHWSRTDRRVKHTTSRHGANGTPFRTLSTVCKESAARVACSTRMDQPVTQQLMAVLLCSARTSTKRLGGCDPFLVRRRLAVCSTAVLADVELALPCLPCCFLLGSSLAPLWLLLCCSALSCFHHRFTTIVSLPACSIFRGLAVG